MLGAFLLPDTIGDAPSLVTIRQLSTFSLDDLMTAIVKAPVQAKQQHLQSTLTSACPLVFLKLKALSEAGPDGATVKLNMTPASIVFSPHLEEDEGAWTVRGLGYASMSRDHLDGEPLITDFDACLTTTVPTDAHSRDAAFVLHSLILVAFTRALHGGAVAKLLWRHLLHSDDPVGFIEAARNLESKETNTSSFLARLAASELREQPEVSKALSEVVSEMDSFVRDGLVSSEGTLTPRNERKSFEKLVSLVTGVQWPDTCIFDRTADDTAVAHAMHAIGAVKAARAARGKA